MRRRVKYCQYPEKCTRSLFKPRGDPLGGTRICSLPTRSSTLREILASLALRVDIAEEKRSDRHTCSLMVLKREEESRLDRLRRFSVVRKFLAIPEPSPVPLAVSLHLVRTFCAEIFRNAPCPRSPPPTTRCPTLLPRLSYPALFFFFYFTPRVAARTAGRSMN